MRRIVPLLLSLVTLAAATTTTTTLSLDSTTSINLTSSSSSVQLSLSPPSSSSSQQVYLLISQCTPSSPSDSDSDLNTTVTLLSSSTSSQLSLGFLNLTLDSSTSSTSLTLSTTSPPSSPITYSLLYSSTSPQLSTFPFLSLTDTDSTSAFLIPSSLSSSLNPQLVVAPTIPSLSSSLCYPSLSASLIPTNSTATTSSGYLLSSLTPSTNYTSRLILSTSSISPLPPLYFTTQSTSSTCRLLPPLSLPLCPSLSYSVPSPPELPTSNLTTYYNSLLSTSLTTFNRTLSTFPCRSPNITPGQVVAGDGTGNYGMGDYSYISTCSDCLSSYTDWLCATTIPRCYSNSSTTSPLNLSLNTTNTSSYPIPSSYLPLIPRTNPFLSRTPQLATDQLVFTFPNSSETGGEGGEEGLTTPFPYYEVPPCLDLCQLVQARCPPFLSWYCPVSGGTGPSSYGTTRPVPFSSQMGAGEIGGTRTERAGDRFGNVWCNSLGTDLKSAKQFSGGERGRVGWGGLVGVGAVVWWLV